MVFREFDRARADASQEVNIFLNKTWGIEHYEKLAPAALLFRVPGYKGFHALPLLLEDSNDLKWTASVLGESFDEIQVSGDNRRGDLKLWISEERLSRLEDVDTRRKSEGVEDRDFFTSTLQISADDVEEEGFKSFLIECFPPGKGVNLQVFGSFIEPYSGRRLNFYAADAREPLGRLTPDVQFKLASWLKARVEDATGVPFSRQELVSAGQEDSGAQPVGLQESDDIPF